MYPLVTLDDGTEVAYSNLTPDGKIKVYFERPDTEACFHHATVWIPGYDWEDVSGFSAEDMARFRMVLLEYAPRWIDEIHADKEQDSPEEKIDEWRLRLPPEVKKHFMEMLEAVEDWADWQAYEKAMAEYRANPVTYTMEEMKKELGLDD